MSELCKASGEEDFSYRSDGCGWSETRAVSDDGQTKNFTVERSLTIPTEYPIDKKETYSIVSGYTITYTNSGTSVFNNDIQEFSLAQPEEPVSEIQQESNGINGLL